MTKYSCTTCEDTGRVEVPLPAHPAQVSPAYKYVECPDCGVQPEKWKWRQ